jgi:hypothetical protein
MTVVVTGEVYAHIARGMLVDPSPSTIWLSPAPTSGLGYVPTGLFLDLWADETRPVDPRARQVQGRLALLDTGSRLVGDATVLLGHPRMTPSGLAYDVQVLEGLVPSSAGACVLCLEWDTAPLLSAEPAHSPGSEQAAT